MNRLFVPPTTVRPAALAAVALLLLAATGALAATEPASICAIAKQKAAALKLSGKLKCHGAAIKKGVAVDGDCLDKVETKFVDAFAKAESRGGCATTGDADDIELLIDGTLEDLLTALPGGPTVTTTTLPPASCDVGDCVACQTCIFSTGGPCRNEGEACFGNLDCVDLNNCLTACAGDVNCSQLCLQDYSSAVPLFNAAIQCVAAQCPVTCAP